MGRKKKEEKKKEGENSRKNIFHPDETFLQRKLSFSTTAIIASQDSKLMRNLGMGKKKKYPQAKTIFGY